MSTERAKSEALPPGRWFTFMQRGRAFMAGEWMARLPPGAVKTWWVLFWHADAETLNCWPSLMTIGRLTGLDKGTVTRALNELEGCGLVSRKRGGGKVRTVYTIHPPVAPAQQVGHSDSAGWVCGLGRARVYVRIGA